MGRDDASASSPDPLAAPLKPHKLAQLLQQAKEALKILSGTPRIFRLIWKSHSAFTASIIGINLFLGLTPLAEMWVTKLLIDAVAASFKTGPQPHCDPTYIFGLLGLMALIRVVANSLEPTMRFIQEQVGDCLVRDINVMIFEKANSLPDISFFENPTFHDKLQRAQNEGSYRPLQLLMNLTSIMRSSVGLISMILVLLAFQPLLALAVMSLSLPHLIVQFKMQYESWAIQDHEIPEVRRMRYLGSVLTSNQDAKEIRLFNLGGFFLGRYLEKFKEFQERHAKLRSAHWRTNCVLANLSALGLAGAYAFIVMSALSNRITLGSMTLYMGATTQIEYGMEAIIWAIAQLYQGNLFMNNVFDFLNINSPMPLAPPDCARIVPRPFKQGIRFENVSFQYPDSERKVLEDVSFRLLPGQSMALVGENGAGKTTLVKLLARLYEPSSGRILVDGIDLKDYDLESWRANMSVIFQDYCRFHMTARENIGIGNVALVEDLRAVKAAAEKGSAAPVIDRLPDKYDTTLGRWFSTDDRGAELSGGEWQKIGLSRAFMRSAGVKNGDACSVTALAAPDFPNTNDTVYDADRPVISAWDAQLLILDEPTAALDAQAEYDVYLRFSELTLGKTTFLISHRFSTVRMADVVLVLENGKIIEQGSHDELIRQAGAYARLYKLQADRYK